MGELTIAAGGTTASITRRGAMTTGRFSLGGRTVEPLYVAGWPGFPEDRLLDRLRGDFPCVPFGITPAAPLPGWPQGEPAPASWPTATPAMPTGRSWSGRTTGWSSPSPTRRRPRRAVDPRGHLQRGGDRVRGPGPDPGGHRAPAGAAPDLPTARPRRGATLELPAARWIESSAAAPEPTSRLLPGQRFDDAVSAPAVGGGTVDLSRLPWDSRSEDLVLLVDVAPTGFAIVNHDEGYRARLTWDTSVLNHLMLWLSQRGRDYAPWGGTNLCVGVEPVTAAFDYGTSVSGQPNPLTASGAATAVNLTAGEELVFRHAISVEEA
ncbi:hypothetical protein G7085_07830 [Tessaracoccus sp. HDW20]|uniref:hypothetical protein n=1 Tax=Tessaracoccus coleopterorum TaxID=2714950 RepID=UPI0018D3A73B|nr:hypothetical protein [Tessaracoccus coleopterorum]NHB84553.1 hypothetical protein [Tessaracoccus coleopterorum]